jgi:peroxiredoxin
MKACEAETTMSSILTGASAPLFDLPGIDGRRYSLREGLQDGSVLAAFFKVSCPTCQFTFPFLERMYESFGSGKLKFWAVSQNDASDTREFCDEYGVKFTALIDEHGYPASNAYGLTNVPSIFLIGQDGKVQESCVGFSRRDLEAMNVVAAQATGKPAKPLFLPGEVIPESKPG